jgi:hypothetical protein
VFEYIPSKNQWHVVATEGYRAPLNGLYGHTTVYHSSHKAFYVYGGLAFDSDSGVRPSARLYSLHFPSRKWALLPLREARDQCYKNYCGPNLRLHVKSLIRSYKEILE